MSMGHVRVLPPDHPLLPEMVAPRVPERRECPGNLRVTDAPEVLSPIVHQLWPEMMSHEYIRLWCTRTEHGDQPPHACLAGPPGGLLATHLVVWGGE